MARVDNQYLYFSDIKNQFPENLSSSDSVFWIKNMTFNWVRQKVILAQADKNLSKEQKDFSQQIEDYRNSLLIYEYENRLIEQSLDTTVTKHEIQDYYDNNPENFLLKRNIVKVIYLKIPAKPEKPLKEAEKLFKEKSIDFKKIDFLCVDHHIQNYYLDTTKWVYFDELLSIIPIKTYNEDAFLKSNQQVSFNDEDWYYFVHFYDYHLKETSVPIELETENIKNIILNRRKTDLIRNFRQHIYDDAEQSGLFEIY